MFKIVLIYCPVCKQLLTHFNQVAFSDAFEVVFWGKCCGRELISDHLEILTLMPNENDEKVH